MKKKLPITKNKDVVVSWVYTWSKQQDMSIHEQRMNGICAGGTGSFIDQMASLLQTDATGLNEYAKNYNVIYPIAARCGVFAKTDIQPLINEGAAKSDLAVSIFQMVLLLQLKTGKIARMLLLLVLNKIRTASIIGRLMVNG